VQRGANNADRLYASDAGLDRDFNGREPTIVARSAGSNKIREALRNLVVREPKQGPLGILEQTREICHSLHGHWIPPVVIRIKVPGCLLDMHLAAERMLDPFLE